MAKDRQYAAMMLDKLIQLDKSTQAAYYEMGRILQAFSRDQLYEILGYKSFRAMVDEELSFSYTTAQKYRITYQRFRELKYNKNEAIQLINDFGYTPMSKILPGMKDKLGKRAIRHRIEDIGEHNLNFLLHEAEYEEALTVFEEFGAVFSDLGRMNNAAETFMEVVRAAAKVALVDSSRKISRRVA